jgi:hypothetical protein
MTDRTVRIGCASGFWGDSSLGAPQLVRSGRIDYLVFDYLAELTMAILAGARLKDPARGWATDFVETAMRSVLRDVAERGIKVISNAGGVNPQGCADALAALARELGVTLRIAVVDGDDVMPLLPQLRAEGTTDLAGAPLPQPLVSANAYLGALPIAQALALGAQVVITGRCVDSAVTLGALMHEFGWTSADHDWLAAGSLAGHLIECGCQATGGLFTDWAEVPDWDRIGYPIVECRADGRFVVTKPPGTGGLVTPATVGEQLLYEIGDPANYLLPDVTADFREVRLVQDGEHRVAVSGARGRPPTRTFKVSATAAAGYRLTGQLTIIGFDAAAKARRTGESLLERGRALFAALGLADFSATRIELLGTESAYGPHAAAATGREVVLRLSVRHRDRRALELFLRELAAPGTSFAPGTTGAGGRPSVSPVLVQVGFLIAKSRVTPRLRIGDHDEFAPQPAPADWVDAAPLDNGTGASDGGAAGTQASTGADANADAEAKTRTVTVPLIRVAWGRSGDKGDSSNIGLIARRPEWLPLLREQVTPDRVADWLAHLVKGPVRRYDLPGIAAINLVCEQALDGGGTASLRNDALGKGMAQQLLAMPVTVPAALFGESGADAG